MSRQVTARLKHRAWVSRGKLHVWGGCIEGQSSKFRMERHGEEVKQLTKVVEVFDMKGKREWTSMITTGDDRPLGIRDAALALLGMDDTRAIVFGGHCGHGATCFHNSLHELDTKSWEWYVLIPDTTDLDGLAPMLKTNSGAVGFTRKGKKYVCVFAGVGLLGSSQLQKHSEYDTKPRMAACATNELHCAEITGHKAEWFWPDVTGSAPPPCTDFSFIKTSDVEVIMMGGFVNTETLHDGVYHLNLENWEWSKIFTSPDMKRTRHFSTLLAPGKILTMGGADENQATREDMCIIDVKTGNTEMVLSEPKICQRQWHSITTVPTSGSGTSVSVVVIGGVIARGRQLDPTMWTKAVTDFMMEFDLMKDEDGTKKWKLIQILELSRNIFEQVVDEETQTDIQAVNTDKKQLDGIRRELEYYKQMSRAKTLQIEDVKAQQKQLQAQNKQLQEQNKFFEENSTKDAQQLSSIKEAQLAFIDANLKDATTYGERLFIFEGSKSQVEHWEGYGLTIQVSQDTLFIDEQLEIAVKPIIAGRFELPEGMQLASAVYAISCSSKVDKTVKLEIQHCLDVQTEDHSESLSFVTAKLTQGGLPYKFNALDGGAFKPKTHLGSISLSHFCIGAIATTDPSRLRYRTCGYLKKEKESRWKMTIMIFKDLHICEERYRSIFQDEALQFTKSFTFMDEETPFNLDLGEVERVDGWIIVPTMYPCKVWKEDIDQSSKCEAQFILHIIAQNSASEVLVHHVRISGASTEDFSIAILCQMEDTLNTPTLSDREAALDLMDTSLPADASVNVTSRVTNNDLPLDTSELHIKICQAIAQQPNVLPPLADELARVELIVSATQQAVHFSDGGIPYTKAASLVTPALQNAHKGPEWVRKLTDCFRNVGLHTVVEEIMKFCQPSSRRDSQGYTSIGARQTRRTSSTSSNMSLEEPASKIPKLQGDRR